MKDLEEADYPHDGVYAHIECADEYDDWLKKN